MKLTIEIDTEGKSRVGRVIVKSDGRMIGGLQRVTFTADLHKNEFVFYTDGHRKLPSVTGIKGVSKYELDADGNVKRRCFPLVGRILGEDSKLANMVELFEKDIEHNLEKA